MTEFHFAEHPTSRWFGLRVNPDPWAIGPLTMGKKGGKFFPVVGRNNQLHSYKEAIKELMENFSSMPLGVYRLDFYFWRRLDSHAGGRKNYADATNLQKATEDALQGILFDNDRNIHKVSSELVEQSDETLPFVALRIMPYEPTYLFEVPLPLLRQQMQSEDDTPNNNAWGGPQ